MDALNPIVTGESAAYATPKAVEASPSPLQKGRGVARCRLSRGPGSITVQTSIGVRTPRPMPLGIGTCLRVSGSGLLALWKGREPRSPSPRPSPQRRGRTIGRVATHRGLQTSRATNARAPSPRGRGRGQARLSHIGRTRKFVRWPEWLPLLWGEGGVSGNGAAGLSLLPNTSLARVSPSLSS